MTEALVSNLVDQLSPEQCVEMQRILDEYGGSFTEMVGAIKGASPEVLKVLTIMIASAGILEGRPVSSEISALIPEAVWDDMWESQVRH